MPDKPEVFRMAELLGVEPDTVTGKLIRLWCWADQNTVDGCLPGLTETHIDRIVHQPGFAAALRKVGWLHVRSGALVIPRFERHNGQTAKSRAQATQRMAAYRERQGAVTPAASTPPSPEKKKEKSREETKDFFSPLEEKGSGATRRKRQRPSMLFPPGQEPEGVSINRWREEA